MTESADVRIAGLVGRASSSEVELLGTPTALQRLAAWLRAFSSHSGAVDLDVDADGSDHPDLLLRVERRSTGDRQLRIGRMGRVLTVEGGPHAAEHLAACADGVAIEAIEVGQAPINRHQHIEALSDEEDDWWTVALDSTPLVLVAAWPGVVVGSTG